jgi:hypothetical protein
MKMTTNLLRNGGFEEDWGTESSHRCRVFPVGGTPYETDVGNIFTPSGWTTWYKHEPGEWDQPEVRDAWITSDPARVHEGQKAMLLFTFSRKHHAGFYQQVQVAPGTQLYLRAAAHSWSNHSDTAQPDVYPHPDDPRWSEGAGVGYNNFYALEGEPGLDDGARNFAFSIGIDPTGGSDPFADTVVWGDGAHIYNAYAEVPPVETVAQGDTVTVFLRSRTLWPFKHCDAYWDDVELVAIGDPPEQPQPPPGGGIWQYPFIPTGSKLGIHGINQDGIVPFCQQAADAGAPFPVVKAVDDLGWLAQVKQVSPDTITIGRLTGPNEGCQGVGEPGIDLSRMADNLMLPILQKQAREPHLKNVVDFWEVANEPDPPGANGYAALSELMIHCMDIADYHGFKIALFSLNMGTPEWDEMAAMAQSGVFSRAYLGGHILTLHEGPQDPHQPIDLWWGDPIPGAPNVPGAGASHFRYRYLYEAIRQAGEPFIPLVISEWYGGLHLPTIVPSFDDMATRVEWWDGEARKDYWMWGCCPFTLGPVGQWVVADWERYYPSFIDYTISIRNEENAQPPVDVDPPPTPVCGDTAQYERTYVLLPGSYDNLWWQCAGLGAHSRQMTIGASTQDAGNPACLNSRTIKAVNPQDIGTGLTQSWFDEHYPGAVMETLDAGTPYEMAVKLLPNLAGDIAQAQNWYDVDFGEHPGGGTIRDYGCLLTACSIILRSMYNKDVTPPWLDKLFVIARSIFTSDHILIWQAFTELFPIFNDWKRIDGPTTLDELGNLLDTGWKVVLRRGSPGSAHFVYLENIGADDTINVIDTQDGQRKAWALQWITGIRAAHVEGESTPVAPPPLVGGHDEPFGVWMVQNGMTGVCLAHFNVTDSVVPVDFSHLEAAGIQVICRVNYNYGGGAGTVPPLDQIGAWADLVAQTMQNARGVRKWTIGNEPNNDAEGPIQPDHYVVAYNEVWERVSGFAKLAPGAIDPYNAELMDPRDYIRYVYENIHGLDFIALHGKTQGSEPSQCWSYDTFTDPPLNQGTWYYHLRTLENQIEIAEQYFPGVPIYATEVNPQRRLDGSNGWEGGAVGAEWVRQSYAYCQSIGIAGVMFYRWSDDAWAIGHDQTILDTIKNL